MVEIRTEVLGGRGGYEILMQIGQSGRCRFVVLRAGQLCRRVHLIDDRFVQTQGSEVGLVEIIVQQAVLYRGWSRRSGPWSARLSGGGRRLLRRLRSRCGGRGLECGGGIGGVEDFQAGAAAHMAPSHAQLLRGQPEPCLTMGALGDQQLAHAVTGSFSRLSG